MQTTGEQTETSKHLANGNYSIRVASRMTGLAVDTLRIWERRYDFPSPTRNSAGARIYSDTDIERLRLIVQAMKLGCRVGEAMRLSAEELLELTAKPEVRFNPSTGEFSAEVQRLLTHVRSGQMASFRRELRRMTGLLGAKRLVHELIGPLMEAVGASWASGELAVYQEHLVAHAIATHLRALIYQQPEGSGPVILLATLPREAHALGLEMAELLASLTGAQVESLGPDIPLGDIVRASKALAAEAVVLSSSVAAARSATEEHLTWLTEHLGAPVEIWLGGKGATLCDNLPPRVRVLGTWDDFEQALARLVHGI